MEEEGHALYAMQLASSSILPMVLKTAVDLGLFDIIANSGSRSLLSPSQIASHLATQKQNQPDVSLINRILRCLASYSILTCSFSADHEDGQPCMVYGLAPVAKYFTKIQGQGSLGPVVSMIQDKIIVDMWYSLKDAVMEGGLPFNRSHGMSAVEYVGGDARFREIFQDSMRVFNPMLMEELLQKYEGFDGLKSLVDVGGGNGSILSMIISKHPDIEATNFDLPVVIDMSPPHPGIKHVAGDMFTSIPEGEAIFMKWMLHSWDDEHCVKLLRNCYRALPYKGKVIAIDMVVSDDLPQATLTDRSLFQFELFMMNMNPAGKERTKREFESLAKAAGFSHIQVPCSAFCFSVVEFHKPT